ncbi:hypothetical protein mru_1117 [Methanobrevibacter ruminantium M1]|uniref:Uncharacterized protein n=2 Tax=Methanobrevibacter ruminantium TaxID=83816 RepID=D3E356_METRM|nr:hypothetical protein mru_1117 [Methanobrevibacter ruminantium M1]
MPRLFKKTSFKIFIALIVIIILLIPISMAMTSHHNTQNMAEISKYENGSTVFNGDNIIDKNKINKYPIVSDIGALTDQILRGDIADAFFSISTGVVPTPASELVTGNITKSGEIQGIKGPAYIDIEKDQINIVEPGNFLYGFNTPYTQAVIVEGGIDIINNKTNETIKHINANDITNDTLPGDMVSEETIKYWYNTSQVGSKYNIEFCIDGLNDNRSYITPTELKEKFPEAYNYSIKYPGGSPVILYKDNVNSTVVSSTYTYLGSHPQYNDANREYNARQFVTAWNGTVIPANTSGCGREGVYFSAVKEANAQSGMATHGVCPPARALRNAVLALGFSLPVGMDYGEDAVLFGYSPSTGIRVTNTLDYPIQINMWTEGAGTGMAIYADVVEYIPNNVTTTNSTETGTTI